MKSVLPVILVVFGLLFFANLIFLDIIFLKNNDSISLLNSRLGMVMATIGMNTGTGATQTSGQAAPAIPIQPDTPKTETSASCPAACNTVISAAISGIKPASAPAPAPSAASTPKEYVIPLGTGNISQIGEWTDINTAQATIDTGNYPNIKQAYFEVIMHIPNASGTLQARLEETSLPYIYYGNVLSTQSGTGQLLSVPISLQSGSRNYMVQMTTSISAGVLDSARIRIVTQ